MKKRWRIRAKKMVALFLCVVTLTSNLSSAMAMNLDGNGVYSNGAAGEAMPASDGDVTQEPALSVAVSENAGENASVNAPGDTLRFQVDPSVSGFDGTVVYTYRWEYAPIPAPDTGEVIEESAWQEVKPEHAENPFYGARITENCLELNLPDAVAVRQTLANSTVRCKVTAQFTMDGEDKTLSAVGDCVDITVDPQLLDYSLDVTLKSGNVSFQAENDELSVTVVPVLSGVAPEDRSYSYGWNYLADDGTWKPYTEDGVFSGAVVSSSSGAGAQSVFRFPLPDTVAARQAIDGKKLQCVVTATAGDETLTETVETQPVSVASSLLDYSLTAAADHDGTLSVTEERDISVTVTPTLSGVAPGNRTYTYQWEYSTDGGTTWGPVPASANISDTTTGAAAKSVIVMHLPSSKAERIEMNGAILRCTVTAVPETGHAPMTVVSDARISISDELLTGFQLSVTSKAGDNADAKYPEEELRISAVASVTGASESGADPVMNYQWQYEKNGSWVNLTTGAGSPFQGAATVEAEDHSSSTLSLILPSEVARRAALNGVKVRCIVTLKDGSVTLTETTPEKTITVDSALLQDGFTTPSWITPALEVEQLVGSINQINTEGEKFVYIARTNPVFTVEDPNTQSGKAENYRHNWEYRDRKEGFWRSIDTVPDEFKEYFSVEQGVSENANLSTLTVTLPPVGPNDDYSKRVILNGLDFRCVGTVNATALETTAEGTTETPMGILAAEAPTSTLLINQSLLAPQYANTKIIVGILPIGAADTSNPNQTYYDYEKPYQKQAFEEGVSERRVKDAMPQTIWVVYEDNTGATTLKTVEVPVQWEYRVTSEHPAYDFNASRAQYFYDVELQDAINEMNRKEQEKYQEEHGNDENFNILNAPRWMLSGELNGKLPFNKVCWNTELYDLVDNTKYILKTPNSLSVGQNGTDALGNTFVRDTNTRTELEQRLWLEEHYPVVEALMKDVVSDEDNAAPIRVSVPVTWVKFRVDEYDAGSETMVNRWLSGRENGTVQGTRAAAARWVWQAVPDERYVLTGQLVEPIQATFSWSRIIDRILYAQNAAGAQLTRVDLNNASQLGSRLPAKLLVEIKSPFLGETNDQMSIDIDAASWLVSEGRVYDETQEWSWRHLTEDADPVTEVGTTSPAGVLCVTPALTGYTYTSNADPEQAKVWYQWGKIVTALKRPDGQPFDPFSAAKTPIKTISLTPAKVDNSIKWATVTTNGTLPTTLSGSVINKPNVTDQDVNNVPIAWTKPAKYDETAETGEYLPTFALGSGYYMDEQLLKDLNGRQPFATLKWKVPKATSAGDTGVVKSYPKGNSDDTFNVVGSASKFGSEIKTAYSNQGWHVQYQLDSTKAAFNFAGQVGKEFNLGSNVYYKIELPPAGGNNYVNMKVTVTNRDSANHNVGIACGTDVQINTNDSAACNKTALGFQMSNGSEVFNCIVNSSVTGETSADAKWVGRYSGNPGTSSWTGYYWADSSASSVSNVDSALCFSWQNRQLKPGDSIVFSAWFGVGTPANEPILNQSTSKATISANGTTVNIDGRVADDSGRKLTLYYTFDKGMEGESNELRLNSTPVTATGRSNYVPIAGAVEKPLNWIEGEYHTVTIQAFNEGGMPSSQKTIALVVEKDEEGNEILVFAEDATVRFDKGTGSGYSVNGAPPANIAAHKLEPITLPRSTMTATNGYKFVGWEYKGIIYPAENQFTVDEKDVTLTAKWIPGNQIMYYVDTYEMDTTGTYTKVGSVMQIEASGANPIVYTPAEREGFTVDTSRSTLSIPAQDNKHIEVYYARNAYTVTFHSGSAPGLREPFSQQNNVRHGTTVTGIPTAGQLSGRQDAKYFNFGGWFTEPNGEGEAITGDTLVTSDIDAYPKWVPVIGSAQITFDYNYANHAQGVSRKDQIELTPVYHEHADGDHTDGEYRYSYGAKVGQTPVTPSSWKNTEGKIFGFVDWVLVDSAGRPTETVVSRGDEFKNFESVTVKAVWQEAYEVATSWIGNGKVNTNARIAADGKALPFGKGDNAMVTWEANPGNSVKHVYIDGELRDELIRDGGCFFDNIQENHTVYVIFGAGSGSEDETTQNVYTITTEGIGCAFTNPSSGHERVTAGTNYTVTWKGASGYKLSSVTVNGMPISVEADATSFTFSGIRRNQNIKVEYVRDTTGGGGGTTIVRGPYRIETKIINGAGITEPQTVNYNQNCTISWSVPYGFMVSQVLINHVAMDPKPTGNSYTFRNVIQNGSVEVLCVRDPNIPVIGPVVSTTIANGSITPTTDVGLLHKGDNHTVEWSASSGYYVAQILIDDVLQGETVNGEFRPAIFYSYTFEDIQEDHRIEVKCLPITSGEDDPAPTLHHIETGMIKGGVIDHPSDLPDHSDVTITWTLAANHRVVKVLLDGQEVLDGEGNIPNGAFTLNDITADHEFQVVCERIPTGGGDDPTENKHKVTTTINYGTADGQKLVSDGDSCTVNWAPPAGYHVTKVEVNGVEQAYLTGNSWTLDSVKADVTVKVTCAADTVPGGDTPGTPQVYYLVPEIINGGSVTGGGTVPITKDGRLNWTVADGYHVTGVYLDDVPVAIADGATSYTFSHTKAVAGTTYHFKVVCELIAYYHVRTSGTGISSITTSADPLYGEDYKVTWTVADGYRIKEVTLNGAPVAVTGNAFTFTKENTAADGTYNLDVVCERISSYTVTTGKSGMGTVSPSKTLNQGDANYEVTWTPDPGYRVKSVTVNGAAYTGDSYIFKYEDGSDATVRVEFEAIQYYTVTTSKQNVQDITPAFGKYPVDEDCTVTWTPMAGYHLTAVKVDGAEQSFTADQTSYTFDHSTVAADHAYLFEVIYERDPEEVPPENPTYTVTTVAVGNGTISNSKTLTAADETYPVTWSAAEGWQIKSVTVDGAAYTESDYTFAYNDHKDVTVKVEFEEIQHYYVTISAQNVHTIRQVKASGEYAMTEDSTVVWTPMDGYHLKAIKVDGVEQSFTADQTSYTFDHSAVLAEHEYRFEVIYERDASGGTPEDPEQNYRVETAGHFTKTLTSSADVKVGEDFTVTWTVLEGYMFQGVKVDGVEVTASDDGSGNYSYVISGGDKTGGQTVQVEVACEKDTTGGDTPGTPIVYSVSTNKTGEGNISASKTLTAAGETYDVVWSAAEGWHIDSVTIDGVEQQPGADGTYPETYTFRYDDGKDVEIKVVFEKDPEYTVLTTLVGSGTVSPAKTLTKAGESYEVSWSAMGGWHVKNVTIDGIGLTDAELASGSYTFLYDTMTDDVTVRVVCERDEAVTPPTPEPVYTITTESTGSGSVSRGATLAQGDEDYTIVWNAAEGWHVKSVTVDGTTYSGENYVFSYSMKKDVVLTVEFEQDAEYTINTQISAGGAISAPATLKKGSAPYTAAWSVENGYRMTSVTVNGAALRGYTDNGDGTYQYTFDYDTMSGDVLLRVTCEEINPPEPPAGYTVSTQILPGNGVITDSGRVDEGDRYPVTWTAPFGYQVSKVEVTVDGVTTDVTATVNGSYTFERVSSNCAITVTCEKVSTGGEEEPEGTYYNVVAGITGGSIDGGKVSQRVREGNACSVSWTPEEGFYISEVIVDGESKPICSSWTFTNITENHSVQVICLKSEANDTYYVNVDALGASTNGTLEIPVGTDHTVTWTANPGYHVVLVTVNGSNVEIGENLKSGSYEITGAAKAEEYDVVIRCEKDDPPVVEEVYYDINVTVEGGTYSGETHIKEGGSTTIAWEPNFGYVIKSITIDDSPRALTLSEWTVENIDRDHSIRIVFDEAGAEVPPADAEYLITTSISDGGTITPPITVKTTEEKQKQVITWDAPEGFRVASVKIDGIERSELAAQKTITFTNISGNHSVAVTCEPIVKHTITAVNGNGTITASPAEVENGGSSTVTWSGNPGFILDSVTVDGRKVSVGAENSYTFENVTKDHTIVVVYKPDTAAHPDSFFVETSIDHGTITPSITVTTAAEKAKQTIQWQVADGYRVKRVTVDGRAISNPVGNGEFVFTNIAENHKLSVESEKLPSYTITTGAANVLSITPTKQNVEEHSDVRIDWMPISGFVLKSVTVDGDPVDIGEATSYTFHGVASDHSIFVEYVKEDTSGEEPPAPAEKVKITVSVTNGTYTGGGTMNVGTRSNTVTWTPKNGYEVVKVSVDSVEMPAEAVDKNGGSFTFTDITEDHSVSVECRRIGDQPGEIDPPEEQKVYLETTIVGGTFQPDNSENGGVVELNKGADYTISWTPDEGLAVQSVIVDGEDRPDLIAGGKLILTGVTVDHTLRVVCGDPQDVPEEKDGPFHIYTDVKNGSISKPFVTDEEHNSYTVRWTPNEKYKVVAVTVDGNANAQALADGYITFNPITEDHTVYVYCQLDEEHAPKDNQYTVDVSVQNGTYGKSADVVDKGGTVKIIWKPYDGYEMTSITIDGVTYKNVPNGGPDGEYTFNNIQKNHTVEIVCEPYVEKVPQYYKLNVKTSGGDGAVITNSKPAVLDGTEETVTWKAKSGWRIDKVSRNGVPLSDEEVSKGAFTFTVNSDNEFIVYVSQQGATDSAFVLVSTAIDGGWISNGSTVEKGDDFEVHWRPADGYIIKSVTVTDANGAVIEKLEGDSLRSPDNWSYMLTNLQSNTHVSVHCERQPAGETPIVYSYQVDTVIENGTITGAGTVTVGANREVTWKPADGCEVTRAYLYSFNADGTRNEPVDIANPGNSYKLENIQNNYLVEVVCKPVETGDAYSYDVETKISNGTINGPFIGMKKNDVVTVQWTAADGYQVERVIIDGVEKSGLRGKTEVEIAIEADDHTVEVICSQKNPVTPPSSGTENYMVKTFLYGGRGEITPWTGSEKGGDVPIQWKVSVDNHYKVSKVYVDGLLTPVSEDNVYTFEGILDNHTLEVYLEENLVEVSISYEGEGTVSPSRTMFWGESYGVVKGIPAPGYRLESVIVNGVALAEGETVDELLPRAESGGGIMRRAVRKMAARLAEQDAEEYPYQNQFYFDTVKQTQTIHYVFVPESGAPVYAPYGVSVNLIGGSGLPDASKKVAVGADTSIGWTVDAEYYVERITAVRNGLETEVDALGDINLSAAGNSAELTNVQTDTVINVYLKRGTMPSKEDINDFSLSIDIVGPGSNDPNNWVEGEGVGMPAGTATAKWHIAPGHRVTMVTVDGVIREDLLNKDQVPILMKKEDVVRDHHVIVYLDGEILPGLEKKAGESPATVDDVIPYTITVWNETDEAIWKNVTLTDKISEGLDMDVSTLKLYRVDSDGNKTEVTGAKTAYDTATRTVTSQVGDIGKGVKYELSFSARVTEAAVLNDIDIGNSVKATGSVSGDPSQIVEKETNLVYPGGVESVIPKTPKPNIVKTVESSDPSSSNTHVGDILTYTIDVWNGESGSVWKNVQVRDTIPEGLELFANPIEVFEVAGDSRIPMQDRAKVEYDEANRILSASLGDLLYGRHYLLVFKVRVMPEAVGEDIGNVGQVAGNAPDNTLAQAETDPIYPKELDKPEKDGVQPSGPKPVITKTATNLTQSEGQSQIGDIIEYAITVKNDQFGSTWKNVVVRDRIPEGQQIAAENIILRTADGDTVLDPAVYNEESRLISIYLGDIGYEQSYQIVFTAEITGSMKDYDIGNIAWANGKNPLEPGGEDPIPGTDDETKPGDPYFNPDDDWVDEGGTVTDKVYPSPEDHLQHAGPYVAKKSHNTTHPNGETQFGDIVEYEIEVGNTADNSKWDQVCIVDTLPKELKPDLSQILLIHPDGTVEKQRGLAAYDETAGTITVRLPDSLRDGENYWLRYRARVAEVDGEKPAEIVNKVAVTGVDYDGKMLQVDTRSAISYPKPVPADPENPSDIGNQEPGSGVGVKTGDDRNLTKYVFLIVTSATLCGGIAVYGKKKEKKNKKS
ncbi:isopeptide-forming domain-containing fimbrial protein [Hominifimenecus sp. rT4P-3]|uniref:isopeptide-forming domain-containing fimbrial protein n=1 Tax=Hominifimenecus sp. rT4P-3 TaxID=3242979 RepID=UPI003DA27DF6